VLPAKTPTHAKDICQNARKWLPVAKKIDKWLQTCTSLCYVVTLHRIQLKTKTKTKTKMKSIYNLTYRIFSTLGLPRIYNGQFICDSEILCAFVAGINISIYHLARCSTRKSSNCK
jgi:hypothetical protein